MITIDIQMSRGLADAPPGTKERVSMARYYHRRYLACKRFGNYEDMAHLCARRDYEMLIARIAKRYES